MMVSDLSMRKLAAMQEVPYHWVTLRFLNFAWKESTDLSEVEYFVGRFSSLLPFSSDPTKMNQLGDEFVSYQLLEKDDMPADVHV